MTFACLTAVSFVASMCSFWYLWYLASRVSDPGRGLVHPRTLGDPEAGTEFTVYLSSGGSALVSPELYLLISVAAFILLVPLLWWRFPLRKS